MTDFLSILPSPSRPERNTDLLPTDLSLASYTFVAKQTYGLSSNNRIQTPVSKTSSIPPYGSRKRWIPKDTEDFEDGGAFPEIHVAQFPLDMGRCKTNSSKITVPIFVGQDGKLQYDAVIRQGLENRVAIYTSPSAAKPKWTVTKELQKRKLEAEETDSRSRAAINAIISKKLSKGVVNSYNQEPEYIKYTPANQNCGHNAECSQRIIRMVEAQVDPLEPPKFQHKRVPHGPPSPPPAILHSPPRKLTASDQAAWKIPPCVSNWKNQKGYTIPLDKRLQADGRNLQEISVNDKFASLSESLYIAERTAREEIRLRNELLKQKHQQEEIVREDQLRELASKARQERSLLQKKKQESGEKELDEDMLQKRREIEIQRKKENERDFRLQKAGKKLKRAREDNRDIFEKVALGQAKPTVQTTLFDSRLFNQSAGISTGYDGGEDDKYNIYDKPLFADRSQNAVYRFDSDRISENLGSTSSVPSFAGAGASQQRNSAIEFEQDSADPFGFASLIASSLSSQQQSK